MKVKKWRTKMKTVKQIREAIENKTLDDSQLRETIKFFAENIEKMTLGEEVAFKDYIKKGSEYLKIDISDIQNIYDSFKK
jgi:hypothetical protein